MPGIDRRQIVTPEAVLIELQVAGLASRSVARLIDLLAQGAVLSISLMLFGIAASPLAIGSPILVVVALIAWVALIVIGYPIACEAIWNGRTFGKRVVGLRVVTDIGGPVRFRHAALRGIVGIVDCFIFTGFPAMASMIVSRRSQRLGDLAAGTMVVMERSDTSTMVPVAFPPPPGTEAYVASLDVSGLSTEQFGTLREYLLRVRELDTDARRAIAERIGTALVRRWGHPPPPGMPAELYLVCVAAAYQQRHGGPYAGLVQPGGWQGFGSGPGGWQGRPVGPPGVPAGFAPSR